jgi:hypothetical protein
MSTGLNCEFNEVEPGRWFYVLEDWDAPKMAWDWREYATAYGPFPSYEAADDHLRRNHANPGGHNVNQYKDGNKPDEVMQKLLTTARAA